MASGTSSPEGDGKVVGETLRADGSIGDGTGDGSLSDDAQRLRVVPPYDELLRVSVDHDDLDGVAIALARMTIWTRDAWREALSVIWSHPARKGLIKILMQPNIGPFNANDLMASMVHQVVALKPALRNATPFTNEPHV